ncbi:hypothetical protein [Rhizobium cauense]|uniref:hypothetical protein n=1 Tax=Rhizobium cauense TaxID=1166683 RepID=UPI001CB78C8A|nr:hypothetical protein [Rhizobium cauense]
MATRAPSKEITLDRLAEMLVFAAKLVDRKGPIAQPILDRCEREYLAAKQRQEARSGSQLERVQKLLGAANIQGVSKAPLVDQVECASEGAFSKAGTLRY